MSRKRAKRKRPSWRAGTPPAGRTYYSIGEVASMYDVEEHVLRYWEEVTPLAPERSPSSDARMYTQSDLALIQQLKYLIQECGYAPALASALLKNNDVETDLKVRDQLTQVKGQIEEMLHLIEEMKGEQ